MNKQNFWQDKLNNDEKLLEDFSIGKGYRNFMMVLWLIGFALLILVGIFFNNQAINSDNTIFIIFIIIALAGAMITVFYYQYYLNISHRYALTNKRILIKSGWLQTKLVVIDYTNITDIYIFESLLNKIFTKTATLSINTAGGDIMEGRLLFVQNPYEVKRKISQLTEEYRNKMIQSNQKIPTKTTANPTNTKFNNS